MPGGELTAVRSPDQKEFTVATPQEFVKKFGGKKVITRVCFCMFFFSVCVCVCVCVCVYVYVCVSHISVYLSKITSGIYCTSNLPTKVRGT